MMVRHDHNNFWADKLQDAELPDVGEAWEAMAALLDREIPSGGARYGQHIKRWSLLLILLLLLIGVCNCPGRNRLHPGPLSTEDPMNPAPAPVTQLSETPPSPSPSAPGSGTPAVPATSAALTPPAAAPKPPPASIPSGPAIFPPAPAAAFSNRSAPVRAGSSIVSVPGRSWPRPAHKGPGSSSYFKHYKQSGDYSASGRSSPHPAHHHRPEKPIENDPAPDFFLPAFEMPPRSAPQVVAKRIGPVAVRSKKNETGTSVKKDAGTPNPAEIDKKGWVAGLGLNQFFTVGKQERSDYNSGGTSGGFSDYIPVPMIRYYFSRKWFIQLEAQFNAPQYTNKDLLASETPTDILSASSQQVKALYIKKLFYLNLPLSFHYSPVRNVYVGTGLQFSRLSNGVGLFQDKVLTTGIADSVKSAKIENFKGDSTYRKIRTGEFRFLLDLSYNYHKFIIGARYNQSLSRFLDVKISTTQQVTQARNSSLQLYIRYILWDGRRPRKLSPE